MFTSFNTLTVGFIQDLSMQAETKMHTRKIHCYQFFHTVFAHASLADQSWPMEMIHQQKQMT